MFYKGLLLIIFAVFGTTAIFSQSNAPVIKDNSIKTEDLFQVGEISGNINRTAIYLPKPNYPTEARFAGVEGSVKVEITIEENGTVNSAKAVSGNEKFYSEAEQTARKTRFTNRTTDGKPPKAAGFIVYNFVIAKAGWLKTGYDLTVIQKVPALGFVNFTSIKKAFQTDWETERELLDRLAEMRRVELENQSAIPKRNAPVLQKSTTSDTFRSTMTAQVQIPVQSPPTPELISVSQNLLTALQNRLSGNEADSWRLRLGINLVEAFQLYRNPATRQTAVEILRPFAADAPSAVTPETLNALKNIIVFFGKSTRTMENDDEIRKSLAILFTDR